MIVNIGMQKKVRQLDLETGEEIDVYESITEAAEDNYITYTTLSRALNKRNGIIKSKKLRFEYVG